MAAAVYGGSPRHSRHQSQPQSSLHHHQQSPYHHHTNSMIVPPVSYQSPVSVQSPYHHHLRLADVAHRRDKSAKRKSAVEMLAESKPFYVKSEMVLDRQQQLSIRGSNSASSCKYSEQLIIFANFPISKFQSYFPLSFFPHPTPTQFSLNFLH